MEKQRSSFSGKLGFVLATAGSAVGLGNLWRFPTIAARNGGGIFLLVYLILVVTFGFTLMCAEILLGRKTGQSVGKAFSSFGKKYGFIGALAAIVPMIILPYYSVIGGWICKYVAVFVGGQITASTDSSFFGNFITAKSEPIFWFLLFLIITAVIVLCGVEKGVEKASKLMMPLLVILAIFVAVYAIVTGDSLGGLKYYLLPDFNNLSFRTLLDALSQLFYSMSLAMGIMITYGSYMKKDVNVENAAHQVEVFDTGIAFLAGLIIIPAVFTFNGGAVNESDVGPGLMFQTLPKIFATMPGGQIIGALFFILVFFAALTSSISLMETVVSIIMDKFKLGRKLSCVIVITGCLLLGIPSSLGNGVWSNIKILGMDFLTFFDFISNSVIMPIVALLTCIFVGYVIKPKVLIEEAETEGNKFKSKKMFSFILRYIAPVCILIILIGGLIQTF